MRCPCGREAGFEACCGPFIRGWELAPTAEALMRSRYSAYAIREIDYLVETHDPLHPPDREGITRWARSAEFIGLEVLDARGGPEDDHGVVEFIARSREDGVERAHHERSRFERRDGRWYYVGGGVAPAARPRAPGRNDPCPCGSGKKHKKCCGA